MGKILVRLIINKGLLKMYQPYGKRFLDFAFSFVLIIILFPIFIGVIILLYFTQKDIFFIQTRPGKNAKPFPLYKFKTLRDNQNLAPQERVTTIGKYLRKTKIDELPQLINILRGEMSFVGPRPLLSEYLAYYNDRQALRHRVKPGLTGLCQIKGGNRLDWQTRLELDVRYTEQISFIGDISILLRTIPVLLKPETEVIFSNYFTRT